MKFIILIILSFVGLSYAQVEGDVQFIFMGSSTTSFNKPFILTRTSQFANVYNTIFYSTTKRTVIYLHGYKTSFNSTSVQTVARAYLARTDHNIIVVDWSKFSMRFYPNAVSVMPKLAELLATMLQNMRTRGLNLSRVHLVGHSLGAQLSGMIGTIFKTTRSFSFCRITGLDPAGPLFIDDNSQIKNSSVTLPELGRSDAIFVDIIHTDADGLGFNLFMRAQGHADFWVNGGNIQKGCEMACLIGQPSCLSCSHSRVWAFYAESVARRTVPPYPFVARQCRIGATSYNQNNCNGSAVTMGYHLLAGGSIGLCKPVTFSSPNYWLTTRASSPYSLS